MIQTCCSLLKNSWKETGLCLGGWDFLKKRKTRAEKTPVEFGEGTATSTQLRKSFQPPPNVFLLACKSVMCPLSVLSNRIHSCLRCLCVIPQWRLRDCRPVLKNAVVSLIRPRRTLHWHANAQNTFLQLIPVMSGGPAGLTQAFFSPSKGQELCF